ncbi:hypothetical protein IAT40_006255 [Kwoniella sp. CBS 6097]
MGPYNSPCPKELRRREKEAQAKARVREVQAKAKAKARAQSNNGSNHGSGSVAAARARSTSDLNRLYPTPNPNPNLASAPPLMIQPPPRSSLLISASTARTTAPTNPQAELGSPIPTPPRRSSPTGSARPSRASSPRRPLTPILEASPPTDQSSTRTRTFSAESAPDLDPAISPTSTVETTPSPITPFHADVSRAPRADSPSKKDVDEDSDSPSPDLLQQLSKFPYPPYRPENPPTTNAPPVRNAPPEHGEVTGLGIRFGSEAHPRTSPAAASTNSPIPGSPPSAFETATPETPPSAARIQTDGRPYPLTPWRRPYEQREGAETTAGVDNTTVEVVEVSPPDSPPDNRPRIDFSASPEIPHETDVSLPMTVVETPMITLRPALASNEPSPEHELLQFTTEDVEPEESKPPPSIPPGDKGKQKSTEMVHAITTPGDEAREQEVWYPRPMVIPESPGETSGVGMSSSEVPPLSPQQRIRLRGEYPALQGLTMDRTGNLFSRQPSLPRSKRKVTFAGERQHLPELPQATKKGLLPAVELAVISSSSTSESQSGGTATSPQPGLETQDLERADSGDSDETIKASSQTRPTSPNQPFGLEDASRSRSPRGIPLPSDDEFDVSEWYDSPEEEQEDDGVKEEEEEAGSDELEEIDSDEDEDPFEFEDVVNEEERQETQKRLNRVDDLLRSQRERLRATIASGRARLESSFQFGGEPGQEIDPPMVLFNLGALSGLFRSSEAESKFFFKYLTQLAKAVYHPRPPWTQNRLDPSDYPLLCEVLIRAFQVVFKHYSSAKIDGPISSNEYEKFLPPSELWMFLHTADLELIALARYVLELLEESCAGTPRGVVISLCLATIEADQLDHRVDRIGKYRSWSKRQSYYYESNSWRLREFQSGASPEFVFQDLAKKEKLEGDLKKVTWFEIAEILERDVMPAIREKRRWAATQS